MSQSNAAHGLKARHPRRNACIAQGIQLEVFDGRDGSQLLYAAQVALSTLTERKRKK